MTVADTLPIDSVFKTRLTQLAGVSNHAKADSCVEMLGRNAREYGAGQRIAFEGGTVASVLCVLEGWIALSKTLEDGERQIIDFVLPGDVTTAISADGATSCLEVEALTDVVVATFNHADWEHLQTAFPGLRELAEHLAAATQARLSERMLRLGKGSAPMRIAYALLELCVRLRSIGQTRDHTFHLPLTQQHLGEFTGLSSVHVCRTLRRLARRGIIATGDHLDIRIIDLSALSDAAGIDVKRLEAEIVPEAALNVAVPKAC